MTLTWNSAQSAGVGASTQTVCTQNPDLGTRDPLAAMVCWLSTWPSPSFTWHLRHPAIYYSQILHHRQRQGGRWEGKPKRGDVEITTVHPHTSNPVFFETTSAVWFYLLLNGDWISMSCITLCCAVQDCKVRQASEGKVKEKVYTFTLSVA